VGLAYSDAVRLLGGSDSRVMTALDRLTSGVLLAATVAGSGLALSLFEARAELLKLSTELVSRLSERLRGLDRFGRSERLAAAHAVIVVAAYFDALSGADLPIDARDLKLTGSEQAAIATGAHASSDRLRSLADTLLGAEVPMPSPQWPYEITIQALRGFYENLSKQLLAFVSGLAVYERLDETRRARFAEVVSTQMPARAVADYEDAFRRLAAEFPEVAFWANQVDHQATRADIRQMRWGLEGLERALSGIALGRAPDERRSALWHAYRAALDRPFLSSGVVPAGLTVPSLGEAYVNPDFRVTTAWFGERIGDESSWADVPVREDLTGFMAGFLTLPQATEAPLLVLGQPGSGKSVLTQMLAARLPAEQFLVVRVVLRDVAADEELQAQIEHGIRMATGENVPWPDLVRSRGDALPVVLLDGFDELLQATGVSQSDYLKKAAEFQRREANLGRPVTVVITSRTAVADRAQPADGMAALRLEPFTQPQIQRWLEVWNKANADGFARLGVQPLSLSAVLIHAELAGQPLLLAMLALYDADENQLQHGGTALDSVDLYERLLTRFAEREADRVNRALPLQEREREIERELLRLSLAAFSMFNRRRQWVTEAELDRDLSVLLNNAELPAAGIGLRAPLSVAQMTLGRFFFIYEAQATRDNVRLKTYEFLHATFSEFLVARLISREVKDLAETQRLATVRARHALADDAFMQALLSFVPLATRGTVVSFLSEQLRAQPENVLAAARTMMLELFHRVMHQSHDTRYQGYTPQNLAIPARYAAYSANLVTLIVLAGEPVNCDRLFPGSQDPVREWRNLTLLWRSQLPSEGWSGLLDAITVDRSWDNGQRCILLRPNAAPGQPSAPYDPFWSINLGPDDSRRPSDRAGYYIWVRLNYADIRRQAHFTADDSDDACLHALVPFADHLGSAVTTFHSYWGDRSVSAANALITLWLASNQDVGGEELASAYDTCLRISIQGFAPGDAEAREAFRAIFLRQLQVDRGRLPQIWFDAATDLVRKAKNSELRDVELLRKAIEIARELHGDPEGESPLDAPIG
jgi:hypothetical protein